MLPALQAERQLEALEAVSFPHMTPAHRKQLLRDKQAAIRAGRPAEHRTPSGPEDFAAIGIPVTYVKKEPA